MDLRPVAGVAVDAGDGAGWGDERVVEAGLLAELLIKPVDSSPRGTHRVLWLAGARIVGVLDLSAAVLTRPLHLEDCYFEAERPLLFDDARAVRIQLPGCHVRGFQGNALHTQNDLCLGDRFTASGEVRLQGAHIHGTLDCDDGVFSRPGGLALDASRMVVDGSAWFERTRLTGLVRLIGARIGGQFNCARSTFDNSASTLDHVVALDAYGLEVKGTAFLREQFSAVGEVRMSGARIYGELDCSGGSFRSQGTNSVALNLYGTAVGGTMLCGQEFSAVGEVRMIGARIGGGLYLHDSTFTHESAEGKSIDAERLTVESTMKCSDGFTATGQVDLTGARIGGDLDLRKGKFTVRASGRKALDAKRVTVGGTMKCSDGFTATGEVDLAGARIGGDLDFRRGTVIGRNAGGGAGGGAGGDGGAGGGLDAGGGDGDGDGGSSPAAGSASSTGDKYCKALDAKRLTVEGTAKCSYGFTAIGEVDLTGARIGELECMDGSFTAVPPGKCAITLLSAEVTRGVQFLPRRLSGFVDLRSAKVGRWYDSYAAWSGGHPVRLNGFTYNSIGSEEEMKTKQRLEWISRDTEGFVPQPYRQLADVYRREGSDRDAREVQINAEWRRRNHPKTSTERLLHPLRTLWKVVLRGTVGFGYQPWLIIGPIIGLFSFGCYWFSRAEGRDDIVRGRNLDTDVKFNGAIYTADLLVPGANLGERSRFVAVDGTAYWAAGYTLAGWALAAMLIAGLTGVFKRL
ncbi:hypothetical protein ACIBKX_23440 [Streptomyces sp. NPDC050658]|uniref:hypothetical protein n=1 Tax=unclassified Streptomyces TaxID=2593676 RepID=UPI00341713BD